MATAVATGLSGVIVGFLIGSGGNLPAAANTAAVAPAAVVQQGTQAHTSLVTDAELQAYRNVLATDPKNASAATALGNKLYDAGRYAEAVPYYQQALAVDARNADLSTDLATALWYSGRADDALAQYERSLAISPTHAQTLFNLGIVRLQGKQDALGAIGAWEKLLSTNPAYPDAAKVRGLIAEARTQVTLSVSDRES